MCVTACLWLQDDFNFEPCSMTVLEGLKYYHNFFTPLSFNSELGFSLFFFSFFFFKVLLQFWLDKLDIQHFWNHQTSIWWFGTIRWKSDQPSSLNLSAGVCSVLNLTPNPYKVMRCFDLNTWWPVQTNWSFTCQECIYIKF